MDLCIFNPDTDLALADFSENYMPPALIRNMAADLALLPMWWADEAGVVAASAYNQAFMEQMSRLFPLRATLLTPPELVGMDEVSIRPWGWNPALRKWFLRQGVAEANLPSLSALVAHRERSGRHVALEILASFCGMPGCCGEGRILSTIEDCEGYWRQLHGRCLFKAPWSGSGKGLLWCYSDFSVSVAGWCQRVLSVQQRLIGMPIYNKVYDFAMEFWMDGSAEVAFVGYSFFDTNAKGAYQGNLLAPDAVIGEMVARAVPSASLSQVRMHLQEQLKLHFCGYRGYLGVDMMVCRMEDGQAAIFPCVEVNLRMNMGIVAHALCRRFLMPGRQGRFSIEAFASPQALQEAVSARKEAFPAEVSEGRLVSGCLPLVPVTPRSRYLACMQVDAGKKSF